MSENVDRTNMELLFGFEWASAKGMSTHAPLAHVGHQLRKVRTAPLAQLVEQLTLNQWVPGSSP